MAIVVTANFNVPGIRAVQAMTASTAEPCVVVPVRQATGIGHQRRFIFNKQRGSDNAQIIESDVGVLWVGLLRQVQPGIQVIFGKLGYAVCKHRLLFDQAEKNVRLG